MSYNILIEFRPTYPVVLVSTACVFFVGLEVICNVKSKKGKKSQ